MRPASTLVLTTLAVTLAAPALAQAGRWNGWNDDPFGRSAWQRNDLRDRIRPHDENREGRIEVTRFVASGSEAAELGRGAIVVQVASNDVKPGRRAFAAGNDIPDEDAPAAYGPADRSPVSGSRADATYEAAVVDQLVKLGYDTTLPKPEGGQIAELTITRSVVEPAEPPHRPVSGEMDVGVSNRGSAVGLALNLDFTKPAKALLSTRLEARIRDRATGKALWEGRADIATRDGDADWSEQTIATRLADALFGGFPGKSGQTITLR